MPFKGLPQRAPIFLSTHLTHKLCLSYTQLPPRLFLAADRRLQPPSCVCEDSVSERERQLFHYSFLDTLLCSSVMSCPCIYLPSLFIFFFISLYFHVYACVNKNIFTQPSNTDSHIVQNFSCCPFKQGLVFSLLQSQASGTADVGRGAVHTDVGVLVGPSGGCPTWTGCGREKQRRQGFMSFTCH